LEAVIEGDLVEAIVVFLGDKVEVSATVDRLFTALGQSLDSDAAMIARLERIEGDPRQARHHDDVRGQRSCPLQARVGFKEGVMDEAKWREPLELYLFNHRTVLQAMIDGQDEIVDWQLTTVSATLRRIADKIVPPLKCFTCEHAFVGELPLAMGLVKQMFGEEALTMAFCRTCAALARTDLKQRIYARLGGTYEMPIGRA
jgi:hypothetical protein